MPSVLASGPELNGTADDDAPRSYARHCDVGVERVAACAKRLAGDDVNTHPPAHRHVEVARERRPAGMRLHLDVMASQGYAVKAEATDAGHHSGPGAVLEDEAEPIRFRAQAGQVGD